MLRMNIYFLDAENKIALSSMAAGELTGGPVQAAKMDGKVEEIVYVTSSSEALDNYIIENADHNLNLFDLKITGWVNVQ